LLACSGEHCVVCESQVHEGKSLYVTLTGNIAAGVPYPPGQLSLSFQAFHENRLPFYARVLNPQTPAVGRLIVTERPQRTGTMAVAVPVTACLDVYLPDITGADADAETTQIFQRADSQPATPTGDGTHPVLIVFCNVGFLRSLECVGMWIIDGDR